MPTESWLVSILAAGLLVLGAIGLLVVWASLSRQISRSDSLMEERWCKLAAELRELTDRLNQLEAVKPPPGKSAGRGRHGLSADQDSWTKGSSTELPLIVVPDLESPPVDREASVSGLKERHAAIWAMADAGASPEVIARTTGQPIGQIELVLGLRRQVDSGGRMIFPHGPHG